MNSNIDLVIDTISDVQNNRRKLFDLLTLLTTSVFLQTRICSDFSESAKRVINNGQKLKLGIQLRDEVGAIELKLSYLIDEGLQAYALDSEAKYHLDAVVDHIPSDETIKTLLLSRSRDELFTEVQQKNHLLQIASEDALRATKVKSDFMSNMSHEIRTPMNAIIGMTHLLSVTTVSEQQSVYIERIQQSSQHLLQIINDILDFSKIESGNMQLDITAFPLSDLLSNVFSNVALTCQQKGIELLCEVTPDVPAGLRGDFLRLSQILINFISNAMKFTERGEITLKIEVQSQDNLLRTLRFNVSDTGIGISEKGQEKLFKSFQQADTSTTRKYGGTGLGLSISKQLSELMGGTVGFTSKEGRGSDFWFTAKLECDVHQQPGDELISAFSGLRALVVDDNEFALTVFSDQLRRLGFEVETYRDPLVALQKIMQTNQDNTGHAVVFIDQDMPQISGIAFAEKIVELQLSYVPKLVLLGLIGQSVSTEKMELFQESIYKPAHASNIFEAVSNLFLPKQASKSVKPQKSASRPLNTSQTLSGARILLAEDNLINQEVAVGLLRQINPDIYIEIADNGEIAIQKAKAGNWDLIFMDIHMPVIDGIEATMAIRQEASLDQTPILALSANVLKTDRNQYDHIGMNGFLAKPINPDDLYKVLLKWISFDSENHQKFIQQNSAVALAVIDTIEAPLPEPKSESRPQSILPNVKSIDTRLGLQFTNGDENLYLSILKKFVTQNLIFNESILHMLEIEDFRAAERLAHTLKSTSGSIGATIVSKAAATLEKNIKDKQDSETLVKSVRDVFEPLTFILEELQSMLPQDIAAPILLQVNHDELNKICKQLAKLLGEDDIQSTTLFGENDLMLRSAFKDDYVEIENHIKEYDFASALITLNKVCQSNDILLD